MTARKKKHRCMSIGDLTGREAKLLHNFFAGRTQIDRLSCAGSKEAPDEKKAWY